MREARVGSVEHPHDVARAEIGGGATPSLRRKRKRPGLSGPGANLTSIQYTGIFSELHADANVDYS